MDLLYGRWRNFVHFLNAIFQVIKYDYPAKDLVVIGVTGTDGKTTVVHLIGAILKQAGFKTATISSIGAFFDDQQIDTGFHVTTPDPKFLQPLLANFKKQGMTHVVLEATSHGLDQHRLLGCNFRVGVLTNITHEHLDYHKTWERYRDAKSKLFRGVKIAVLNRDDRSFSYLKNNKVNLDATFISYSLKYPAKLWVKNISLSPSGMKFTVREGRKRIALTTPLLGEYNVSNILAAAGATRGIGVSWDIIFGTVRNFKGLVGRLERIDEGQPFNVFVDFAHTPGGLENLLKFLNSIKPKKTSKVIVVYGSAGERDREKRWLMGEVAARLADFSVLTAEDPRNEDPERIIDDITRGIRQNARVWDGTADWRKSGKWCVRILERGEAIAFAVQRLARDGDIVAVCGKGHERSMAYDHTEYPWSDQEAARVALKGGIKKVRS